MSKVEMLIYICMAFFILLALPLEDVAPWVMGGIGFAGSLLGIVAWNVLNENTGNGGEDENK